MAQKLIVEVIGDTRSYERAMGRSKKATQGFESSVSRMGGALKGLAKAGVFAAGALGATGLALVINQGTKELRERQKVEAQTAAALKSTGNVANTSMKQIDALALSLSNLSGVDDEVIKSAETMLLSFTNVRNEVGKGNDIFNRATKDILDFSVRTGRDASSAAVLLGKALEDPANKVSSLARAGIVFSAEQKKVIKSLVDTGHTLEAQKLILSAIETRYRGAAKAAGGTLAGRLNVLRERFRDLSGDLLTAFLPTLNKSIKVITPLVQRFNEWTSNTENQRRMQERINSILQTGIGVFKGIKDVVVPLSAAVKTMAERIGGAREAVKLLLIAMVVGKIVSFSGAITGLSTQMLVATGRAKALRIALLRLGAIGVIAIVVELFIHRNEIKDKAKKWNRQINEALGGKLFGGDLPVKIALTVENLPKLIRARNEMAKLNGEGDVRVAVLDRIIERLKEIDSLNQKTRAGGEAAGFAALSQAILSTSLAGQQTTTTSTGGGSDELTPKQLAAIRKKAAAAATKAFEKALALLDIQAAQATRTKSLQDDLAIQKQIERVIRARLAVTKNDVDLQRQLVDIQNQQLETQKQITENAKAAKQASIFKALGLTAEGDKPTPGSGSLLKRATGMLESIKGTVLDTKKNRQQLKTIIAVLKKNFKSAGKEVRAAILQMLNDIANVGDQATKTGPLTKTHGLRSAQIIRGLGLSSEQADEIQRRLAHATTTRDRVHRSTTTAPGGSIIPGQRGGPSEPSFVANVNVFIDGKKVSNTVTKQQQKDRRRNPRQKRGQHRN